jgi:DNA-binding transcriptional MerR regulator
VARDKFHLSSAEAARRLGVSAKALRLYEAHGLVRPGRTPAGWRVYGSEEIARLHEVLALKSFGFPLARIAELLLRRPPDLSRLLAVHEEVLRHEMARVRHALRLLSAARARITSGDGLSSDDLITLTRETIMPDNRNEEVTAVYEAAAARYFTPADQAALDANGFLGLDQPALDWDALHAEAAALMEVGDPTTPEAIDLARRWMGKVFEATGGDPSLTRKMREVARESLQQPAFNRGSTSSVEMMDFVAAAYGAAIAAGVMPAPGTVA